MPKKDPSQQALDEIRALEGEEPSEAGMARLKKLLAHRSNHVVGRAARLADTWKAERLVPELLAAFDRFMESPVKSDPTCAAKKPIIETLIALGHREPEIYLRGAHHIQMEPVYGGSEDTAATLRGLSGEGLLGCRYADLYNEMTTLLMDANPRTRRIAVESLGHTETPQAEMLLRMVVLADRLESEAFLRRKLRPDEEDADIIALAMHGLMSIAPERSLPFVAGFLVAPKPVVMEGAALAIGEARLPESFATLRTAMTRPNGPDLYELALPMALTRDDEAFDFLLSAIPSEPTTVAAIIVEALAIYGNDPQRSERVGHAVQIHGGESVRRAFAEHFYGT